MEKEIIDFFEGKYTVVLEHSVDPVKLDFYALRYGKRWRELAGDNLVFVMAKEILALRKEEPKPSGKGDQEYHVAYWVSHKMISGLTVKAPDLNTAIQSVCKSKGIKADAVLYAHAKSSIYSPYG